MNFSSKHSKPIIVFDAHSLMGLLSKGKDRQNENIFGGRHWMCTELLDKIFTALKGFGVDLVFFFDGSAQKDKLPQWKRRQVDIYVKQARIMTLLSRTKVSTINQILQCEDAEHTLMYNKKLLAAMRFSCEKVGKVFISEKNDSDRELSSFIQSHAEVIGLFANDSDYLIYPGKFRYFSTEDMNLNENGTLTTMEYPRERLRAKLNLNDLQMAFFASLCGNDIILYEMRKFHWKIQNQNRTPQQKIALRYKIADIARRNATSDVAANINDAVKIFMKNVRTNNPAVYAEFMNVFEFEDKFTASVESYLTKVDIDETDSLYALNETLRYKIDKNIILQVSGPYFIDLANRELQNYWENQQHQLRRKTGVIMELYPELKERKVAFFIKKSHSTEHSFIQFLSTLPEFDVSKDIIKDDIDQKFKLLKWMSCLDHLDAFDFSQISDDMKIDIFTMASLYDQKLMTLEELDVLLWTIVAYQEKLIPRDIAIDAGKQRVHYRAFCIAQMFLTAHPTVTESFKICGLSSCLDVS